MNEEFLRGLTALTPGSPGGTDGSASPLVDESAVWAALGRVIDPEIGLDIVTLGMVYGVEVEGDEVRITFSLTTPGCPLEEVITRGIRESVAAVTGVGAVVTELVWEPRWNPGMIREGAW